MIRPYSFGIALISVSACAVMPGGAATAPKTTQTASCNWLDGYPDSRGKIPASIK